MDESETAREALAKLAWYVAGAFGAFLMLILNGWALSLLWEWFVASQTLLFPTLSVPGAMGLFLIFRFVKGFNIIEVFQKAQLDWDQKVLSLCGSIMYPFLALGMGYVVKFWL